MNNVMVVAECFVCSPCMYEAALKLYQKFEKWKVQQRLRASKMSAISMHNGKYLIWQNIISNICKIVM